MNSCKTLILVLLSLAVISCSKNESISNDDGLGTEIQNKTGIFRDSDVEGLYYETETKSGYTTASGEYDYLEGETVSFYAGDIKLGSAQAGPVMTPMNIASTPNASIESEEVKNIAAFLQTLDFDGDPSNGIKLEPQVLEALRISEIDFTQPVTEIIGEIVIMVKQNAGIDLEAVYPEEAVAHLANTLGEEYVSEDMVYTQFLPVLESWVHHNYPPNSVSWIHSTDENGKIISSSLFENIPSRKLAQYNYTTYSEEYPGVPTEAEYTFYNNFNYSLSNAVATSQRKFLLKDTGLAGMQEILENTSREIEFISIEDEGQISEAGFYTINPDGSNKEFLRREIYTFDENGNNASKSLYISHAGTGGLTTRYTFTYKQFGDLDKIYQEGPGNLSQTTSYYYRDNHSLENRMVEAVNQGVVSRLTEYIYDENEKISEYYITEGEWRSEYLEFFENGDFKTVNTYYQDWLQEEITVNENRSSVWLIRDIDMSGSYRVEYKDADGNITKTEYYDDNGQWLETLIA
ncbi:hypothetical protein [Zunongwangia sp. H14]|uniref:hypothetical protein n=1 Tax=Zunongwangia sp. H14 TaxID=3240792 RepID=UPI003564EF60